MIQLNFWLYLVLFLLIGFAFILGAVFGSAQGKRQMMDGMMERVEGWKGPDGKEAKLITDLRELLRKIARGEHVDESLR